MFEIVCLMDYSLFPAQVTELQEASLARIMCDNVLEVTDIQPNAFLTPAL